MESRRNNQRHENFVNIFLIYLIEGEIDEANKAYLSNEAEKVFGLEKSDINL